MHINKSALILTGILLMPCLKNSDISGQESDNVLPVRLMFYNVENLFDIYDDSLKNDDDFLPSGLMRWNFTRYKKKINSVYKTITAAGDWDPPAVVAFCEVENRKVIEDLTGGTYLSDFGYKIIHEESPDERGIDVCLICREELVKIAYYRYLIPSTAARFSSRGVLYAKCAIMRDTIHLFVNHWPSRRGGVLAGESLRKDISEMLRAAVDSIDAVYGGLSKIIIMGDFNCLPEDNAIQSLMKSRNPGAVGSLTPALVNLSQSVTSGLKGTYRYKGIWEMLDQVMVTPWLLSCDSGLYTSAGKFRIFQPGFLLRADQTYPGMTTFSTYRGYRYHGGFSDHLPVLLDLDLR